MSTPQLTTVIDKAFLGRLCADAISNLDRAVEKHPNFPQTITHVFPSSVKTLLKDMRAFNDHGLGSVTTIASEETAEFILETLDGSGEKAYNELVDILTVWLRVGCHLKDYMPNAQFNSKLWLAHPYTNFATIAKKEVKP